MSTQSSNPFYIVKADDFTDKEIAEYWVDTGSSDGFKSLLNPLSRMPMLVLGGKGSGKTHLLRYFSYQIQKIRHEQDLPRGITTDGYLGIYLRMSSLNASRFSEKGVPASHWETIFAYYYELWMALQTVDLISDLIGRLHCPESDRLFTSTLIPVLQPNSPISNAADLIKHIRQILRSLDVEINNASIKKHVDIHVTFSPGDLAYSIPIALSHISEFRDTTTLFLIDEVDYFTRSQQSFVNTLIRSRKGPCSIKVGARTYGVKTYETLADGEENREGHEFEVLRLDSELRSIKNYSAFAVALCTKRLSSLENTPSPVEADWFKSSFQEPAQTDILDRLDGFSSGSKGKTIKALRSRLSYAGINRDAASTIARSLCFSGHPLLEKFAVYAFYKEWSSSKSPDSLTLTKSALEVKEQFRAYLKGHGPPAKKREEISKFKSDLMAQLCRDNKKEIIYSGVDSLIDISKGFPRHLITILKYIYQASVFNGQRPFIDGPISTLAQIEGIRKASYWFFDENRVSGHDGPFLHEAVNRLASVFRLYRFADKPSECSVIAFYTDTEDLTDKAKDYLALADQWSLVLRDSSGRKDKSTGMKSHKYVLNRMLSPIWELPTKLRAVPSFSPDLVNSIFDPESVGRFDTEYRSIEKRLNVPFRRGAPKQPLLEDLW